jgi:hypothetical protein
MCEGNGFKKYKPQIQIRIQTEFPLYHYKVLQYLEFKNSIFAIHIKTYKYENCIRI